MYVLNFEAFYLIFEAYGSTHTTSTESTEVNSTSTHAKNSAHSTSTSETSEEHVFNTPWQSVVDAFIMTMGDVGVIYEKLIQVPNHIIIGQV